MTNKFREADSADFHSATGQNRITFIRKLLKTKIANFTAKK